jgi:hypothetical protein
VTFDNARRAVLTVSAGLPLRGGAGAPLRAPLLAERTKFESDDSPCADLRFRRRKQPRRGCFARDRPGLSTLGSSPCWTSRSRRMGVVRVVGAPRVAPSRRSSESACSATSRSRRADGHLAQRRARDGRSPSDRGRGRAKALPRLTAWADRRNSHAHRLGGEGDIHGRDAAKTLFRDNLHAGRSPNARDRGL